MYVLNFDYVRSEAEKVNNYDKIISWYLDVVWLRGWVWRKVDL